MIKKRKAWRKVKPGFFISPTNSKEVLTVKPTMETPEDPGFIEKVQKVWDEEVRQGTNSNAYNVNRLDELNEMTQRPSGPTILTLDNIGRVIVNMASKSKMESVRLELIKNTLQEEAGIVEMTDEDRGNIRSLEMQHSNALSSGSIVVAANLAKSILEFKKRFEKPTGHGGKKTGNNASQGPWD